MLALASPCTFPTHASLYICIMVSLYTRHSIFYFEGEGGVHCTVSGLFCDIYGALYLKVYVKVGGTLYRLLGAYVSRLSPQMGAAFGLAAGHGGHGDVPGEI
jgi:hypothetical protein